MSLRVKRKRALALSSARWLSVQFHSIGLSKAEKLTDSSLTDDPGQAEEEHHAPDVEEASHLEITPQILPLQF